MKRLFDIVFAITALLVLGIPMLIIALLVKITSKGPIFYKSDRIGRNNIVFSMYKFRTMKTGTPPVATHLLYNPENYLTPMGNVLRKTSIDEIPQLINIIKGDMSFVGPRPALFNQDDLISLRTEKSIHELKPGLTGWAQVNGRDEPPIPKKVELDAYYMTNQSLLLDLRILFLTLLKVIRKEGISH